MPLATISTAGARQRRGRGKVRGPSPYRLSHFIMAYVASLVGLVLSLLLTGPGVIFFYFAIGVALSRFIGDRIRWWKIANNVENVAMAKIAMVLTWPVSVPKFIVTVALAKWL